MQTSPKWLAATISRLVDVCEVRSTGRLPSIEKRRWVVFCKSLCVRKRWCFRRRMWTAVRSLTSAKPRDDAPALSELAGIDGERGRLGIPPPSQAKVLKKIVRGNGRKCDAEHTLSNLGRLSLLLVFVSLSLFLKIRRGPQSRRHSPQDMSFGGI